MCVYACMYVCVYVYVCLCVDASNKGDTGISAIAEHWWDQQHQVNWEGTRVLDRATNPVQLRVKETLHIQKTPANNGLNWDEGYEL